MTPKPPDISGKSALGSLAQRGLRAAGWGYLGTSGRIVIQLIAQIAMARLMGPDVFGVYAAGAIVIGLAYFVTDMGLGPALVQREVVDNALIEFIFTWQMLAGISLTLLVYWLAGPISEALRQPESYRVLQALSLMCLFQALGATSVNLLRRDLMFRSLHLSQLLSFTIGYLIIGVGGALAGWGVWSLVAAALCQTFLHAAILILVTKHSVSPRFLHVDFRSVLNFGSHALGVNLLSWAMGSIDRILVARFNPSATLGNYTVAYNAVQQPTAQLLGVLQSALFPAAARSSADNAEIGSSLQGALNVGALLIAPAFSILAAVADPLILIIYGERWRNAADVFSPIALAMIPMCLMGIFTPVLWGRGRADLELRAQSVSLVLLILFGWFAAQYSAEAMAWTVASVFTLRAILVLHFTARNFGIQHLILIRQLTPGILISLALAVSLTGIQAGLKSLEGYQWAELPLLFLVGFVAWFALLRTGMGWTVEGKSLLHRTTAALPRRGGLVRRICGLK